MTTAILWFRRDLRLADNAALDAAVSGVVRTNAATGAAGARHLLPVYVSDDGHLHDGGAAMRVWRTRSLASLAADLKARGSGLLTRFGDAPTTLAELAQHLRADAVYCTRDWSPSGLAAETTVRERLATFGVALHTFEGSYLVEPDLLHTGEGGPYRVFGPYWRAWEKAWRRRASCEAPGTLPPLPAGIEAGEAGIARSSDAPSVTDAAALRSATRSLGAWQPGEAGAHALVARFVAEALADYPASHDRPDLRGTTELSPHLAHGEITPLALASALIDADPEAARPVVRQLAWRDFAAHVLHHYPHTLDAPLHAEFSRFPWAEDDELFAAWVEGRTGFPLVDAGMRQLAATGWMHNRVRMVVASFLTKDLLIPWQRGAAYFEDALTDFDPAQNAFNWQWVAGCGADAAPYFRVFNPLLQGKKFDPLGAYVRTWVPESETAPLAPVIDHSEARERALAAYRSIKTG